MYCEYCGNKLSDDAIFCARCGHRVAQPQQQTPPPPPPLRRGSLAPFVLILVAYFVWFFWRTSGLGFLSYAINTHTYSPEQAAQYASLVLPSLLRDLTTPSLHHLTALAGLAAVLVLTHLKKIDPRAFHWKDVVPVVILCVTEPLFLHELSILVANFGMEASVGFGVFTTVSSNSVLSAVAAAGLWLACIVFMLIRSGTVRVSWQKTLICLGALLCVSLALSGYGSMAVRNYVEIYYSGAPAILVYALALLQKYFLFLWIKWMVLLWFAADSGSGVLPFWGRLVFAGVVIAGFVFLAPVILFGSIGFPEFGPSGAGLVIPAVFLLGAVVLLIFRLVHAARRQRQPSNLNLL